MEPSKVYLRGDIDVATAERWFAMLRGAAATHAGPVVVDCMDLTFIDAAGIGSLIRMHNELARQHRALRLVCPSPFLARMLDVLNLTYLLSPDSVGARHA